MQLAAMATMVRLALAGGRTTTCAVGGRSVLRRSGRLPVLLFVWVIIRSASSGRSAILALLLRSAQEGRDPLSGDAEAFGDLVHCQAFGVERARLGAAHAGSTDVERL
jgi:hypothetical protein